MPRGQREPEIGKRIVATRLQRGLSQGTVSRRAGVDPSYLSRIETGKVQPTVRTAARIAAALRMPLSNLLKPSPPDRRDQPCPVTAGGRCLLDLIDTGSSDPEQHLETYTTRQLRLIRQFTSLLRTANPQVLKALEVLVGEMLEDRKEA